MSLTVKPCISGSGSPIVVGKAVSQPGKAG